MIDEDSDVSLKLEKINVIFDSCNATSGNLDSRQALYGLEALGWYLDLDDMRKRIKELGLQIPLERSDFQQLVAAMDTSGCKREMCAVPHSRRGMTLKQLKAVQVGLLDTKWMSSRCKQFNLDHEVEILNGKEYLLNENPDLYSMDKLFVIQTTNCEAKVRDAIPEEVLKTAEVPGVPKANCSFSQLLNPEGLDVDYFVSHCWGHPFERTMKALTTFSEGVYKDIGKDNPDDIVFWICCFALNQHQKAKEVGSSLNHAPFNVALAKAKYGALMVLDAQAKPMKRIWCIFEVTRAKEFKKPFQIITDEGDIANASIETLDLISVCLLQLSAFEAEASDQSDKQKIQYEIIDPGFKSYVGSFEGFKNNYTEVHKIDYGNFDRHICTLMGSPLLVAGLKLELVDVCLRALGMGAMATVANLEEAIKVGVDVAGKFETRFGMVGLSFLYADMGLADELLYILDQGGNVQEKAKDWGFDTPLHRAAQAGHTKVVSLLLNRGANIEAKSIHEAKENKSNTPLHFASWAGQTETAMLLLDRGADINAKNSNNMTPLIYATQNRHKEVAELLRERGAEDVG